MPTVTGVADANGDFNIAFGANYTSAEKIKVTSAKDGATKSIELFAPADVVGGGTIKFSGTLVDFPNNIGTITLSGDFLNIPDYAFTGSSSESTQTSLAKATGLIISNGTESIGANAFQWWRNLKFISFPETLKTIGAFALNGASGINQEIIIHDAATAVGASAFYNCVACPSMILGSGIIIIQSQTLAQLTALTRIEFKGQITSMVANSCIGWSNCNEIIMHATTPPVIATSTFTGLKSTCVFKVPASSVAAYQAAANWSAFASRIQAI